MSKANEMMSEMLDEIMDSCFIAIDFEWWGGTFHVEADVMNFIVGDDYLRIEDEFELEIDLADVEIEKSVYMDTPTYAIKHTGVTGIIQDQNVYLTILN